MQVSKWVVLSLCATPLACPSLVSAAQQKALGLVNLSAGVKPTSAANKFKLETDPTLVSGTASDYYPTSGLLNNYFDPTQYQLVTNGAGSFTLGTTVAGVKPYEVTSFEVGTKDGGLIEVQDAGAGKQTYTDITSGIYDPTDGPVGGGESGFVYDINFQVITDEISPGPPDSDSPMSPLSSDNDQDFFDLNLVQIGPTGKTPYSFAGPDSLINFTETQDAIDNGLVLPDGSVYAPQITSSLVPEVSTAGFLCFVGVTLFARRRRDKKLAQAQASDPTPPDQA